MSTNRVILTLERVLLADAATCVLMGIVLLSAAPWLASMTGLTPGLLAGAGLVLFPCATLMLAAAGIPSLKIPLGWLVVIGNALWAAASLEVVFTLSPTPLGGGLVMLQAAMATVVGVLEWRGLRAGRALLPAHG